LVLCAHDGSCENSCQPLVISGQQKKPFEHALKAEKTDYNMGEKGALALIVRQNTTQI
jgi:hypothetical protein